MQKGPDNRQKNEQVILVSTGAHNPPHIGHLFMLLTAKQELERKGYEVVTLFTSPSSTLYLESKKQRGQAQRAAGEKETGYKMATVKTDSGQVVKDERLVFTDDEVRRLWRRILSDPATRHQYQFQECEFSLHKWESRQKDRWPDNPVVRGKIEKEQLPQHPGATVFYVCGNDLVSGQGIRHDNIVIIGREDGITKDVQIQINSHKKGTAIGIDNKGFVSDVSSSAIMNGNVDHLSQLSLPYLVELTNIMLKKAPKEVSEAYVKAYLQNVAKALQQKYSDGSQNEIIQNVILLSKNLQDKEAKAFIEQCSDLFAIEGRVFSAEMDGQHAYDKAINLAKSQKQSTEVLDQTKVVLDLLVNDAEKRLAQIYDPNTSKQERVALWQTYSELGAQCKKISADLEQIKAQLMLANKQKQAIKEDKKWLKKDKGKVQQLQSDVEMLTQLQKDAAEKVERKRKKVPYAHSQPGAHIAMAYAASAAASSLLDEGEIRLSCDYTTGQPRLALEFTSDQALSGFKENFNKQVSSSWPEEFFESDASNPNILYIRAIDYNDRRKSDKPGVYISAGKLAVNFGSPEVRDIFNHLVQNKSGNVEIHAKNSDGTPCSALYFKKDKLPLDGSKTLIAEGSAAFSQMPSVKGNR